MIKSALAFAMLPLIASCVAPRGTQPAPVPAPAQMGGPTAIPTSTTTPVATGRYAGDWSVADIGSEEWQYSSSDAGNNAGSGAGSRAVLTGDAGARLAGIGCSGGRITLSRAGPANGSGPMTIRTSFAERSVPIASGTSADMLVATLDARDPLWDQIVFSRGRFLIEIPGGPPLIAPVRPEIARVVEDCRG